MKDKVEVFFHSQQPYTYLDEDDIGQYNSGRLDFPNTYFDPEKAHQLYNQYHEQYAMADEAGVDGIMTNEHHSSYWNMKPSANIDAAVISRITTRAKIAILGNIIPINDPVRMAEELAMLDCYSNGRLISGFVRGGAVETLQAGIDPTENRERFEEAPRPDHQVLDYAGSLPVRRALLSPPGGQPLGAAGAETPPAGVVPRRQQPGERGLGRRARIRLHEPGCDNQPDQRVEAGLHRHRQRGWIHAGSGTLWLSGTGVGCRYRREGPGIGSRLPVGGPAPDAWSGGALGPARLPVADGEQSGGTANRRGGGPALGYEGLQEVKAIIVGSPDTVIKKLSDTIEELNPGYMILIGSDGNIPHDDVMRSVELLGREVVPALHEIELQPYQ